MNIIFFGSDNFAVLPLRALIADGYRISCVVTQPDRRKGRHLAVWPTAVKLAAQGSELKVYQPDKVNSAPTVKFLKALKPDLFVVIAYGQILSQEILDIPKIFSINVHASLLPKYRGAAPINWAIINAETVTGITVIKMVKSMDAGAIIKQQKIKIENGEDSIMLEDRLSKLAAGALIGCLNSIENNSYKLTPQNEADASLASKLKKEDGRVSWNNPARQIYNLIRGCLGWPGAFTYFRGKLLKIYKARVSLQSFELAGANPGEILQASKEGIVVFTGKGDLIIEELQIEGKRRMATGDFIAGYKILPGEILGQKIGCSPGSP